MLKKVRTKFVCVALAGAMIVTATASSADANILSFLRTRLGTLQTEINAAIQLSTTNPVQARINAGSAVINFRLGLIQDVLGLLGGGNGTGTVATLRAR